MNAKTTEIEGLLRALEGKGYWDATEQNRVEEIIMGREPDDSYLPTDGSRRRKPFEIEGDWTDSGDIVPAVPRVPRLDDSGPARPLTPDERFDDSLAVTSNPRPARDVHLELPTTRDPRGLDAGPPLPSASLEERVATLERREQLVWEAIHKLEQRLGVAKDG